jgi:hypothetical protein
MVEIFNRDCGRGDYNGNAFSLAQQIQRNTVRGNSGTQ